MGKNKKKATPANTATAASSTEPLPTIVVTEEQPLQAPQDNDDQTHSQTQSQNNDMETSNENNTHTEENGSNNADEVDGASSGGVVDVRQLLNQVDSGAAETNSEEIEHDLHHLVAYNVHPLDAKKLSQHTEQHLHDTSRDGIQSLVSSVVNTLTCRKFDDPSTTPVFVLAPPPPPHLLKGTHKGVGLVTVLPREKPIPKPRAPTKWEQFAQSKGIGKHKRDRMVWDEDSQQWRPRYGYQRAGTQFGNDPRGEGRPVRPDWMMEVRPGEDFTGVEDPFEARRQAKQKKLRDQQARENANKMRAEGGGAIGGQASREEAAKAKAVASLLPATVALTNLPNTGSSSTSNKNSKKSSSSATQSKLGAGRGGFGVFRDKDQLTNTIGRAAVSTASLGRFDTHRASEPKRLLAKRHKRDAVASGDAEGEKQKSILVLNKVVGASNKPSLNAKKAIKFATLDEEKQNRKQRKVAPGKGKKRKNLQDATRDRTFTKNKKQRT